MSLAVIAVDRNGVSGDGESYSDMASPEMVNAGYMINRPVMLKFPNGRLRKGNQVLITPVGMEFFRREVPLEIRNTMGET